MIALVLVLVAAAIAAYKDVKTRRIPNEISAALLVAGLTLSATHGLQTALVNTAVSLAVFLAGTALFSLGLIGGGDVKLAAAAAAVLGWPDTLAFLLYTILAGGLLGIAVAVARGRIRPMLSNLSTMIFPGTVRTSSGSRSFSRRLDAVRTRDFRGCSRPRSRQRPGLFFEDFVMNTRRMTLLLAILLAVGTGWLTLNYINNVKRSTLANNQPRTVVVAAVDIPARTTITSNMLQQTTLPGQVVERDAISDTSQANGTLSLITIPAGSQITASKVGRPQDVGLPVRLAPGNRAVSIQIDKVKGISGMIEPGDRVDIIAIPPRSGDALPQAATILRGIRVLAVGNSMETTSATPSPEEENSTTVTLEVTPHQADLLASADQNTTLRLALRSPREPLNSEPTESLQFPVTQVAAAPAPAPAAAAPAAPAPQPAHADPPAHGNIMIIDGDHIGWSTP